MVFGSRYERLDVSAGHEGEDHVRLPALVPQGEIVEDMRVVSEPR